MARHTLPILLVALATAACSGKPRPVDPPRPAVTIDAAHLEAQLTAHVESYGRNWGEKRRMSGFVLVAQHDQTVYQRAFGHADRERRAVATADTSFRIGSVTKQFTAAAILLLAEDGKLSTADTIGQHLPGYPAVGAAITIHQLLTHTSGIHSYTAIEEVMATRDRPRTVAELMATFQELPLDFPPGERFEYSNSGYVVLGAIIEQVSGMSYADFLRTRLFEPAGMTRTVVGDAVGMDDRALGYMPSGDTLAAAAPIDMSIPFAAGAVRSTAADLVRWHRALSGDAILSAASKQRMYTPEQDDYAYGWFLHEVDGHQVLGHGGGIDGFLCEYLRVPDLDLVVVVWSNNQGLDVGPIARAAVDAALGAELAPVDEPALVALDAEVAAKAAGTYRLTDASRDEAVKLGVPPDVIETVVTMELAVVDGALTLKPVGQDRIVLEPTGPTTFVVARIGVSVEITATAVRVTQGGLTLEYVREADG